MSLRHPVSWSIKLFLLRKANILLWSPKMLFWSLKRRHDCFRCHESWLMSHVSYQCLTWVMSHISVSHESCLIRVMSHMSYGSWVTSHESWLMSHGSWVMAHESCLISVSHTSHGPCVTSHESYLMSHVSYQCLIWVMSQWLFCEKWPATEGILCVFTTQL